MRPGCASLTRATLAMSFQRRRTTAARRVVSHPPRLSGFGRRFFWLPRRKKCRRKADSAHQLVWKVPALAEYAPALGLLVPLPAQKAASTALF